MFGKQRFRVVSAAAAASLAFGLASGAGPATAASSEGSGTNASAQACTTWQYVVKSRGTIRYSPGGSETGATAQPGELVNVHQFSGYWYKGDFYWEFGRYYSDGWILSSHLDYLRCW